MCHTGINSIQHEESLILFSAVGIFCADGNRHLIQNQGKLGLVGGKGQSGAAPPEQLPWQATGQ